MRRDLRGKRMLITGASSGIGRALAERAAPRGARLLLFSRSADKLDELASSLKAEAVAVPGDVTSDADRRRALQVAQERFGGLDLLVNNAGVASFGHFADSTEDILRRIMEVNFFAPIELIRLAIPALTAGNQPAIVNVASMCGRRGMPAWPEYSASKFGLCGMTEAFRGEFARFDIDVLLIVPGLTKSALSKNLLRNEGRMKIPDGMAVEQVAEGILHAIETNKTETVLGGEARQILLMNRFFPRWLDRLIGKRVRELYSG